jgi:hypothetical protein
MLKIRSKVCCHFGRTSQGDVVGRVSAHYIALVISTPDRKTDFYYIGTFKIKVDST